MFANQLKAWQDALALNLRLRNPQANADETNAAAQRMILHLLFVRLCKDRGIGDSGQLLLPSLHLPGQPEFAVLPIETLGQAYEELVGHDGHLSAPANGLSKAKPNFKKAAGIYYTPSYIVKHIVRGTIGRLCHGKTPRQIAGLRVLDPACGTGSFLLGAYEYLLDWHREWYVRGWPPRHAAELYRGKDGQWRLTVRERQRILISNIYGVDIDPQAVEIARLSLLLKAMDEPGANVASATDSNPRAWLDINLKIKCGNALIGPEFVSAGSREGTIAFDWHAAFPEVVQSGGFDAVIGNPPYGAILSRAERDHLGKLFQSGITDTAALLMLQAHRLTRPGGWNGFIVPKPFTYSSSWRRIRERLLGELAELVDAGKAWRKVKLEQVIYILQRATPSRRYSSLERKGEEFSCRAEIPKSACDAFGFYLNGITRQELALGSKIRSIGTFLGDLTTNRRGAMLQGLLGNGRGLRVVGGKQVQPFHYRGQKGFLPARAPVPPQARVKPGSILVQNIVAHIAHPAEHIQLISAVVPEAEAGELLILDTVNQLTNHSHLSSHYLLALLSSRLINWYIYRFIFARAVRTLHFDGPVSRRIPIPNLSFCRASEKAIHSKLADGARLLASLYRRCAARPPGEQAPLHRRIAEIRAHIDRLVGKLYGLTPKEIIVLNKG